MSLFYTKFMSVALVISLLSGIPSVSWAADYCRDFTQAIAAHNDALYKGFIYGYVMGWSRNRNPIATRAVSEQVERMTTKYCMEKPSDDLANVVGMWTEVVTKSLK